jgi:hypothetical protein
MAAGAPILRPVVKAARMRAGQVARFCCSMYWRWAVVGIAARPAK